MARRAVLVADLAVKALLGALLLAAVLFPDLQQFEGKAMAWRAATYPLAALIVPAWWWLRDRRRPFPALVDLLLTLPFLIDTLGNVLDLYDTVDWWDDANHFFNWALLTAAFGLFIARYRLHPAAAVGLGIGFGATTAILWELMEYVAFIRDSPELETAYTDTLGDLVLGLCGSVVAAVLVAGLRARRFAASPEGT